MFSSCRAKPQQGLVSLWMMEPPYSVDPLDYDAFSHHIAFTSVHVGLVTNYRAGQYAGVLAQKWQTSSDHKEWRFVLRKDISFENGDPVTPRHVIDSWRRMARILKERGSEAGFFETLVGYHESDGDSDIPGIAYDDSSITLRFTKPQPKLLNTISFGLYGVVHPSCYDRNTGRWKDPHKTLSSGPYRIREWGDKQLVLELRRDFPAELRHPRPLSQVLIRWENDERLDSDLVIGSSREDLSSRGLVYFGGPESEIAFVRCQSWTHPDSPLSDPTARRSLRDAFYAELGDGGTFRPIRSFFPLAIKGVKELSAGADSRTDFASVKRKRLTYRPFRSDVQFLVEPVRKALEKAGKRSRLEVEVLDTPKKTMAEEFSPNLPAYKNDWASIVTSILIDDPDADIRFMFKSKEGIRLPDPTGRANAALSRPRIDIQRLNEILWDDAIIWPVLHFSAGLWAKPELDLSMVNLILPPTAFHWIGWTR